MKIKILAFVLAALGSTASLAQDLARTECLVASSSGQFFLKLPGNSIGIPGHLDWDSKYPYGSDKGHFDIQCWPRAGVSFIADNTRYDMIWDCWGKPSGMKPTRFEREGAEISIDIMYVTPQDTKTTKKTVYIFAAENGVRGKQYASGECYQ